jgi:hypothetical protein
MKKKCSAEAAEELKKQQAKEGGKGVDEMTKDLLTKMQKDLDETKANLVKAGEALQMEKDARRLIEIKADLDRAGVIGNVGDIAKKVLIIEKTDPQLANDIIKMHKDAAERLAAAGVLDELGSSQGGGGSAFHQLRSKQEEILKKDKILSPTKAWKQTIRENPELYKQYSIERK